MIAEYGGLNPVLGTSYLYVDHLGSTRLLTDGVGNQQSCNDYLPFGGDILSLTDGRGACFPSAAPSGGIKFTGQERDAESGLDFFGARYFSWAQGRLTSFRMSPSTIRTRLTRNLESVQLCPQQPAELH